MEERNEFLESRIRRQQSPEPNDTKRIVAGVLAGLIVICGALLALYLILGRGRGDEGRSQAPAASSETPAPSSQEASSEPSAEPSTAQPTEPSTAEPSTEVPTEPATEAPTEPSTQAPTEPTEPTTTKHEEVIIAPVLTGQTVEEEGVVFDLCQPQEVTAKGHVNLRVFPGVRSDEDIVGTLYHGEWATRTGIGRNGWARLEWNGQIVYCVGSYVTTDPDYSIEE